MSKVLCDITIQGNKHEWVFSLYADPKYIPEWREDGIEIDVIEATVPLFIVEAGLMKPWIFIQKILNFKY